MSGVKDNNNHHQEIQKSRQHPKRQQQNGKIKKKRRPKATNLKITTTTKTRNNSDEQQPSSSFSASASTSKWSEKDKEALRIAVRAAVNPGSEQDWQLIADALNRRTTATGRGTVVSRSWAECRERARVDGLLPMDTTTDSEQQGPSSQSKEGQQRRKRRADSRRRPPANQLARQKGATSPAELLPHQRDHFNKFFASQECPVNELLDVDDSLMRDCYGSARSEFGPPRQARRPMLIIRPLRPDSTGTSSNSVD